MGVLFGAISGFFGGWVDAFMMRVVDVLLSVPLLFLVIVLAVIFQPSLTILILVIGFTAWLVPARLVRGETLSLRVREYVLAVRVMGGGNIRIVLRHIIPNTIGTIIVNATFQVADAILLLAALGFIGLGVPAPKTDWGSMLADGVTPRSTATGGRSTRPALRSCSSSWHSTSSATPCATRSRCASSGARTRRLQGEVAGSEVLQAERAERRLLLGAEILRERAPRAEAAARRRRDRRGKLAAHLDDLASARQHRIGNRDRVDQASRVRMGRALVDLLRRPDLDELAEIHDADGVCQVLHDREVVGDDDVGQLVRRCRSRIRLRI